MFEGPVGKRMMIEQGYVPSTCILDDSLAGPLIYSEISAGRDVCAGCNHDRAVCGGRPNQSMLTSDKFEVPLSRVLESERHKEEVEDEEHRVRENPVFSPCDEQ